MVWRAHPDCPTYIVAALERAVNALPPEWLLAPVTDEVFNSIDRSRRRVRGLSLADGFDVVQTGAGNKRVPGARFQCIHHGIATRNYRKLEARIEKDEEGHIVSRRKRGEILASQTDYPWSVRVSWKDIG
jgi:hypothetical protein